MRRECRERFPRHHGSSNPDMHHGTCVTHVPWCMPGSLTSVFLWSQWRGKHSRHSWRMRKPQFNVSGKKPIPVQIDKPCNMLMSPHTLYFTLYLQQQAWTAYGVFCNRKWHNCTGGQHANDLLLICEIYVNICHGNADFKLYTCWVSCIANQSILCEINVTNNDRNREHLQSPEVYFD